MTEYEKNVLYPTAKKILESLGYNTDGDVSVHAQFLKKYEKEMNKKPSKPPHRNKIYWDNKKSLAGK